MPDSDINKSPLRRRFQPYVFFCLAALICAQLIVYYMTRIPIAHTILHDLTTSLDKRIPFIPQWVTIYFLSYLSWAVSAVLIISDSKKHGYRFTAAYCLALFISGIIFVVYPGTLKRPEITGSGIFNDLMRFLYKIDSATNLCPSLHVMASYFCWRGSVGADNIPKWLAPINFIFLILVCLSILFIKQHVIIDIPTAVVLSELALLAARVFRLDRIPRFIEGKTQK